MSEQERRPGMKPAFAILIVASLALAACNTVAGVGEDVTGAARWAQGNSSPY